MIKHKILSFFLHILLNFEIIWTGIDQIIRLGIDINFSEIPWNWY